MASQDRVFVDRRKILAKVLRTKCVRGRFDLRNWYNRVPREDIKEGRVIESLFDESCYSTACVAGWAAAAFQSDWKVVECRDVIFLGTKIINYPVLSDRESVTTDRRTAFNDAVTDFGKYFGLTFEESESVVLPMKNPYGENATSEQCADLLEGFNDG